MTDEAPRFWVDGKAAETIPVDDRGLLLADGAFETLRCDSASILYSRFHLARLTRGLGVLGVASPAERAAQALADVESLLTTVPAARQNIVRVTVTRGSGPRGYRPPTAPELRTIIALFPAAPMVFMPRTLGWSDIRWSSQPAFHNCKLLARTEQVMAANEAMERGVDDVLMRSAAGSVISSSCANVIVRFGRELLTPSLGGEGLAGTRREVIREVIAPRHDLIVRDVILSPEDLEDADELMLCNGVIGVQPVAALAQHRWDSFNVAHALFEDIRLGLGSTVV